MPRDPKGQLGQRSTAKLPPGSLSVSFPNLANTVAEVGKLKPYGSGLEDPPAAGDPEPAPAAATATAAAAPWAGPPLIGSRGRSSRARGTPLPAGHQVWASSAPGLPALAALPEVTRRARTTGAFAGPLQKKPEKGSGVPHRGRETVRGPRGDNRGDVSCQGPIGRCQSVALRCALTSRLPASPQAKLSGSWRGIKEPPTPATFWNAGS